MVYGRNTDLEDRKRAEDTLRSNEQSLRLIVASSCPLDMTQPFAPPYHPFEIEVSPTASEQLR
jgi:hypothetical protein